MSSDDSKKPDSDSDGPTETESRGTNITDLVSSAKLIKMLVSPEIHEKGVETAKTTTGSRPKFRNYIETDGAQQQCKRIIGACGPKDKPRCKCWICGLDIFLDSKL